MAGLNYLPGCDVTWSLAAEGDRYDGKTGEDTCRITSKRSGQEIIVNDHLVLTEEFIAINDIGRNADGKYVFGHPERPAYHNARVRYFDGWAAMKVQAEKNAEPTQDGKATGSDAPTTQWRLHRPMRLNDQGGQVSLVDAQGKSMGYRVELAHLTRSASKTSLMKLALVDEATDKTVAYAWSDPKSEIIGLNADWIQVGLKLAKITPSFALPTEKKPPLLDRLSTYLVVEFSSTKQTQENDNFRDISLRTCRVKLPELGEHVLYVEQAVTENIKNPYRQRLYQLSQLADGRLQSAIYTLDKPKAWVGACDGAKDGKHPAATGLAFKRKPGCEVFLSFDGSAFRGQTQGKACATSLRGARYAQAEVELTAQSMKALDRGFDENDKQVWGSEHGPYQFERISNGDARNQSSNQ